MSPEPKLNLKLVFNQLGSSDTLRHMLLSEIQSGQIVQVVAILGRGSFRRRLLEFGLVPGTRVERLRVAPLGDPIELLVRGASLSIRKAEASVIEVEPAAAAGAEKIHPSERHLGAGPRRLSEP